MVVVERELAGSARPAYGQMSAGIGVAEEDIGDGVAAFDAGIPGFDDRGDVFGSPSDVERAAVDENEDDGLACRGDGFEEFFLAVREAQRRARGGFAALEADFADDHHDDVVALRDGDCVVDGLFHFGVGLGRLLFQLHDRKGFEGRRDDAMGVRAVRVFDSDRVADLVANPLQARPQRSAGSSRIAPHMSIMLFGSSASGPITAMDFVFAPDLSSGRMSPSLRRRTIERCAARREAWRDSGAFRVCSDFERSA